MNLIFLDKNYNPQKIRNLKLKKISIYFDKFVASQIDSLMKYLMIILSILTLTMSCKQEQKPETAPVTAIKDSLLSKYTEYTLTTDLSHLSENQQAMVKKLIAAADMMNELFWYQAYGDKSSLPTGLTEAQQQFIDINYGPWDRLDGNAPFIQEIATKPAGANFYPGDMTKAEFETFTDADKNSLYTFIRRDSNGLKTVWYHEQFKTQIEKVAHLLEESRDLAEDADFKNYLDLRAKALRTDDYLASDMQWMDMKNNMIDIVIGPIENYEDQLMGIKTSYEGYVLIKDIDWSKKLEKFAQFLPELQKNLPCDDKYKQELPGTDSDLNAYDVVYYAGDCNAGSKTIAINLPNDERVQKEKGTRRLQLKNAMRAKFDKILIPISKELITEDQQHYITFDAFFANTMFHEVAHGLGIKNVVGKDITVREALKEHYAAIEEGKADVLGLYMVLQLLEKGELEGTPEEYMTTFMTSIFRSVRFGASSAHGKANMLRFNYFQKMGAFTRNEDGTYTIKFEKMKEAANALSSDILSIQGDGDYTKLAELITNEATIPDQLQEDLNRLATKGIPVDVIFNQGVDVLFE